MYPKLDEIEDILFELSLKIIKLFAEEHHGENFYAFGFDVNTDYGEVLLCFNTEESFQKTAKNYIEKWNYSEDDLESLRMSFGDWEYHGINLDYSHEWYPWVQKRKEIENYISALFDNDNTSSADDIAIIESEKFSEAFLETIIKVLIRLEKNNIFDELNMDENFMTLIVNHDEDEEKSINRIEKIRART